PPSAISTLSLHDALPISDIRRERDEEDVHGPRNRGPGHEGFHRKSRGGGHAGPVAGRAELTLSKVDWMEGRADRLRRNDEGDPRQALPVLLALRRTRRSAGPGVPVPRVRPIRGGPPEVDRRPRRVRGTARATPPNEP